MKCSPKLKIPAVALSRNRSVPLPEQIYAALRRAIADGAFPPGSRLPASRVLARSLRVSRNSVLAAYERLSAEGLICGRTGSGTRVSGNAAAHLEILASYPQQLSRLRESGYPANRSSLSDPDGNAIYVHG